MTTNKHSRFTALALGLAVGAGCAHAKANLEPSASSDTTTTTTPKQQIQASTTPAAQDATPDDQQAQKDLEAAVAGLKNTRVFFGMDEDKLTEDGRNKLANIGDILAKHSNLHMRIEGNCDERGTEAYNLVLGQRRADVARSYILTMGAHGTQVDTVSYGKERPAVDGHSEQSWSQNRRDDMVVVKSQN